MTAATRPWNERTDPDSISPHRPAWMRQAACYGLNDDTFYPPHGMRGRARETWISDAVKICNRCPVLEECQAQAGTESWGIWAGQLIEADRVRDNDRHTTRPCRECNQQFVPDHGGTRYCDDDCRDTAARRVGKASRDRKRVAA